MTILEERVAQLDKLDLHHGSHPNFETGHCAMELVSWLAGEPFSDAPKCVSPVIRAFVITWNDSLRTDDERNRIIRPLLTLMVGTATTERDEEERAWMATDWLVRKHAPAWLRLAGLTEHAHALETLAALTGRAQAVKAQPTIDAARNAADAAADAAGAAADDAVRAAGDAAWAAARAAADDAARAAGDAAWATAGDAAWAAAQKKLEPTVERLQISAVLLVTRMCDVGRNEGALFA